ncbi:MAG: MATE family efflux transporter, partial [Bacteroides fragilis]
MGIYNQAKNIASVAILCSIAGGLIYSFIFLLFKRFILSFFGTDDNTFASTSAYIRWVVTLGAAPSIVGSVLSQIIRSEGASRQAG